MAVDPIPWIAAAHFPASTSSPSVPWEQRHQDELAFKYGTHTPKSNASNELRGRFSRLPRNSDKSFDLSSIRESELVNRSLYALQGIPVAVSELQVLAKLFTHQVADRSSHRLSTLWQRSASTKSVGKLLAEIAQAGFIRMQLEEFVDFFLKPHQNVNLGCFLASFETPDYGDFKPKKRGKMKVKQTCSANITSQDLRSSPPYSLINQAYAKAVKNILQGHSAALNTLTATVLHRRSAESRNHVSLETFTVHVDANNVVPYEMTLLELYLHTSTLRVQLQALEKLCLYGTNAKISAHKEIKEYGSWPVDFSIIDSPSETATDFSMFPRGADLLTFLYDQLHVANGCNAELLQYLFSSACQPYLSFIQSWLYRATVRDPFKEFIVEETQIHAEAPVEGTVKDKHLNPLKWQQAAVSVPCFLEGICTQLLRAGQQLQVLFMLAETGIAEISHKFQNGTSDGFVMLKSAVKCWTEFASEDSVFFPLLIFNKRKLLTLLEQRRSKRHLVMQNFDLLFSSFYSQNQGSDSFKHLIHKRVTDKECVDLKLFSQSENEESGNPSQTKECKEQRSKDCNDVSPEVLAASTSEQSSEQHTGGSDAKCCQDCTEKEYGSETLSEKQRKRWEEPPEVVIVHDLVGDKTVDGRSMIHTPERKSEIDTVYEIICKSDAPEPDGSENPPYSFPILERANVFLRHLLHGSNVEDLSSVLLSSSTATGISFFFPEMNGDKLYSGKYFGRPFIHKLAQKYNYSSMSQYGGYRKTLANFDTVSQVFWNFEDCTNKDNLNTKVPSFFAATNVSAIQKSNMYVKEGQSEWMDVRGESVQRNGILKRDACSIPEDRHAALKKAEDDIVSDNPIMRDDKTERDGSSWRKSNSFGGETWETYMLAGRTAGKVDFILGDIFGESDIPLEVIVDKCIIQEVLSQYQCISHFTVRLLYEVFGLPDHFAALRRYFLMERGDWADSFITALCNHVWHPTGAHHRQLEVQTLLEAAIQNSSCEYDIYTERLYVCIKRSVADGHSGSETNDLDHVFVNKTSISAFDFLRLGYHVEWPLSLVITPKSLRMYNSIFCYLLRVKFTVHVLHDIWQLMKGTSDFFKREHVQIQETLILLRQTVMHFMVTLQGYIEAQLQNVWTKLVRTLSEEGTDLQNMEYVHDTYIQESSHVCFLSDDMKSIKSSVDNIMQCVLDLHSCLYYLVNRGDKGKPDIQDVHVRSTVEKVKNSLELSIRQLHDISCNTPSQLPFSYFWTWLDFNGFFREACTTHQRTIDR